MSYYSKQSDGHRGQGGKPSAFRGEVHRARCDGRPLPCPGHPDRDRIKVYEFTPRTVHMGRPRLMTVSMSIWVPSAMESPHGSRVTKP